MTDPRLREHVQAEMQRLTGKQYAADLDTLDDDSLRELLRFVRDAAFEKRRARQQALREPWRR